MIATSVYFGTFWSACHGRNPGSAGSAASDSAQIVRRSLWEGSWSCASALVPREVLGPSQLSRVCSASSRIWATLFFWIAGSCVLLRWTWRPGRYAPFFSYYYVIDSSFCIFDLTKVKVPRSGAAASRFEAPSYCHPASGSSRPYCWRLSGWSLAGIGSCPSSSQRCEIMTISCFESVLIICSFED